MSWILPGREIIKGLKGEVRVNLADGPEEICERVRTSDRRKRWRDSPKGIQWALDNRERRNDYHRDYYARNHQSRRDYLNKKQKQYRQAKKKPSATYCLGRRVWERGSSQELDQQRNRRGGEAD